MISKYRVVNTLRRLLFLLLLQYLYACSAVDTAATEPAFVGVENGRFTLAGRPYYFAGINFWHAAYLGRPGADGDRDRLITELDLLATNNITNLRVLAASEPGLSRALTPVIQPQPGMYNETILQGLDFLLVEMAKRNMKAVIFLNNYWQWSGGMTSYVSWVTNDTVNDPDLDGDWDAYITAAARFYPLPAAQTLYRAHIEHIVSRINTLSGVRYSDDPTIMSWQLANEPRTGTADNAEVFFPHFTSWIADTAAFIRSLDDNHLISTGSEGAKGTADRMQWFIEAHQTPYIDYLTCHLWPKNWGWLDINAAAETYPQAVANAVDYINAHIDVARQLGKPLVLEEFGIERDNGDYRLSSTTVYRDRFLNKILELVAGSAGNGAPLMGSNVWSWGGAARSGRADFIWRPGDDLMGDPPQEPQGLNAIFDSDRSTLSILRSHGAVLQRF